jgi:integration host factor subunit beta
MTKSELIARLSKCYPQLVAKDAELSVNVIFDAMTTSLMKGRSIEILRRLLELNKRRASGG